MRFWRGALVQLSVDGDTLPTEFRLFKAGENASRKGSFLFDDEAAAAVMAAYREHGVDVMIDLEHLAVAPEEVTGDARNFDSSARGWCKLELRDGELWAVDVKWTEDGARRLRNKEQRYISPAFSTDDEGRIVELYNIALTALPATDHTPALVAASTANRGPGNMKPEQIRKALELLRAGKTDEQVIETLSIDVKTLQAVVKAMGGDPSADLATMMGTVAGFAKSLVEAAAGKQDDPEPPAEPAAEGGETAALAGDDDDPDGKALREGVKELETLRKDTKAMATELATLKREREERETAERRELVAGLVVCRKFNPADVWADVEADKPSKPKSWLRTMPLEELRSMAKRAGATQNVPGAAPEPPKPEGVTVIDSVEVSPFELARVKRRAALTGVDEDAAVARYVEVKGQQILGANQKGDRMMARMISRPLTEQDVITNEQGRFNHANLVTLTNPVKPIEEFGASSQRALEEFRLEHNTALAAQPASWAEQISAPLQAGSLKDTYPINFSVSKYTEKVAETAAARTSNNKDVTVSKKLYHEAEECELVRLQRGDFAYIKSWMEKASRMARARQFLRNHLVAALLEANGAWVDGANFFSASHKVDPFDAARTFRSSATWSNYQSVAAPFNSANLTAEKGTFLYGTPGPDGEELGYEADGILFPTILNETAKDLLTVQDLILSGVLAGDGDGTMGTVRNPHFQSGMKMTRGPELTGTDSTASWYLVSHAAIAAGMVPWVLSEDPDEEVVTWDESSDFYKNGTGFIKYESRVRVSVCLLYPHGIRLIAGA